jgi:hypothetical protein
MMLLLRRQCGGMMFKLTHMNVLLLKKHWKH